MASISKPLSDGTCWGSVRKANAKDHHDRDAAIRASLTSLDCRTRESCCPGASIFPVGIMGAIVPLQHVPALRCPIILSLAIIAYLPHVEPASFSRLKFTHYNPVQLDLADCSTSLSHLESIRLAIDQLRIIFNVRSLQPSSSVFPQC